MLVIIAVLVTGILGYFAGILTSHYKEKLNSYISALPILARMIYDASKPEDADKYNESVNRLLLIGNKRTVQKLNKLISYIHHPDRLEKDEITIEKIFQQLISEMRSEIKIFPHQYMNPEDFTQIYTKFTFFYDIKIKKQESK